MSTTVERLLDSGHPRLRGWAEVVLVFLVFCLHGAWPVPDVNESHYLGKAIHYWDPSWIGPDFFLDSQDTHPAFYFTFGWLARWLPPVGLAWTGRIGTWALLAWAWRRLSVAVLPRPWWSVLGAVLLVLLNERLHMAGEWIVGGVEAKGFAYVAMLLGLEALVRGRWNRAWLLFGLASMFHVLVGGWAVVAAAVAWVLLGGERPPLRTMWLGLLGGFALSLPGLVPAARLTWGVDPEIVRLANQIYVFVRLKTHLNPGDFPGEFVLRFALLMGVWVLLRWRTPEEGPAWRMHAFVAGSIAISMLGVAIAYATAPWPELGATLLRLYWFRLADVAVPLGVALGAPVVIQQAWAVRPRLARAAASALVLLAAWDVGQQALLRARPTVPRSYRLRQEDYAAWRAACQWIANSGRIPPGARFLTPRGHQTFRWDARRSEVVTWKDIPQDPVSIIEWWRRVQTVHGTGLDASGRQWFRALADEGEARLRLLGRHYGADYVLTESTPRLSLPVEYENEAFVVYRLWEEQRESP